MLFDETGAILLVRFVVPREDGEFVFWALPGGEIETGETEVEAAAREVREELGLELKVAGPVYCDSNQFFHQRRCRIMSIFYAGQSAGAKSLG